MNVPFAVFQIPGRAKGPHRRLTTQSSEESWPSSCLPSSARSSCSVDTLPDTKVKHQKCNPAPSWRGVLFCYKWSAAGLKCPGEIKGRRAANLSPLHCSCSRHLLHTWSQRCGRRGRRRHGHHQRGGRTQQHRREERVFYLKRPGWERRAGMLKVVVLEESFFKPPIGHKKAWGRDLYRKYKCRTGAAKRRCWVSYPSLPGLLGPILYSLINLQTLLCLVRFCLFCCSPFFPIHSIWFVAFGFWKWRGPGVCLCVLLLAAELRPKEPNQHLFIPVFLISNSSNTLLPAGFNSCCCLREKLAHFHPLCGSWQRM